MDSFLSNLYKESMEKTAGAELKEFYDSLSVEQLEQVLGLTKVAVGGDATPEIPDGSPVKKYLDAAEKAVAKKTTPPELPTASSTVAGTSTMESGKQLLQSSTGKPEPTTPFVPREIKTTDDPGLGSRDAESKTAAVTKHRDGAIITGVQTPKHFTPEQVAMFHRGMRAIVDEEERKGTVIGGKKKSSTAFDQLEGKTAEKRADQVGRMMAKTAIVGPLTDLVNLGIPSMIGYHMGKNEGRLMAANKEPMDDRSIAAALLVPGALGYRYGKEKGYAAGKGNKSGAEKRAELLITALRAIKDAPEHVKHAAAKYVGERL